MLLLHNKLMKQEFNYKKLKEIQIKRIRKMFDTLWIIHLTNRSWEI